MQQQKQKVTSRDQYIIFTNWTDQDFDGIWDKKIYPFKAQKSYEIQFALAEHFAKHLVDRELHKMCDEAWEKENKTNLAYEDRTNLRTRVERNLLGNVVLRQELMDKCITVIPQENQINIVKPREVQLKEVVLKRDERAQKLEEKFGEGLGLQINRKALAQQEEAEKFEEAKVE